MAGESHKRGLIHHAHRRVEKFLVSHAKLRNQGIAGAMNLPAHAQAVQFLTARIGGRIQLAQQAHVMRRIPHAAGAEIQPDGKAGIRFGPIGAASGCRTPKTAKAVEATHSVTLTSKPKMRRVALADPELCRGHPNSEEAKSSGAAELKLGYMGKA